MAVKDGLPSTDFSRMNREYIKKVAEGSAGSVLPEIAAADEGKFLGVVSGEAAWAEAGGGGGNANILFLTEDYDTHALSETYATIKSAMEAGTIVIIKHISETGCIFAPVLETTFDSGYYVVNALNWWTTAFPISQTYACEATTDYPVID